MHLFLLQTKPEARRLCSLAALLLSAASSPSFPRSPTDPPWMFHPFHTHIFLRTCLTIQRITRLTPGLPEVPCLVHPGLARLPSWQAWALCHCSAQDSEIPLANPSRLSTVISRPCHLLLLSLSTDSKLFIRSKISIIIMKISSYLD